MEPKKKNIGKWTESYPSLDSIDDYYCHAEKMCEDLYAKELEYFRGLKLEDITLEIFWSEYIWCVYVSGFRASTISEKFDDLKAIYDDPLELATQNPGEIWDNGVKNVFANEQKFISIYKTACILWKYHQKYKGSSWFYYFKKDYLSNIDDMIKLPYIGPVTSYHLARNVGFDAVKPDVHLVRLSDFFSYKDPQTMCLLLSKKYKERLGVVDLILWYAASTWGTYYLRD